MNLRSKMQNIGLLVVATTSLLYAGSKLDFINLPTKQESVFGLITFIGVFILAFMGTNIKKTEKSPNQ